MNFSLWPFLWFGLPGRLLKNAEFYGHGFACRKNAFFPGVHKIGAAISGPTQRALRDILMSRGKNCLPIVSRQFLTRNYPRRNRLLKCLPNCLSPTGEGIFSSFKITPAARVIARQLRDKNCLGAIFAPGHQDVSQGPLGRIADTNLTDTRIFLIEGVLTGMNRVETERGSVYILPGIFLNVAKGRESLHYYFRRCSSTVLCTVPCCESVNFSVDFQLGAQLSRQPPQSSSKGNLFVRVRFGGVPSTVEEVVRVRFCCLLS